MEWIIIDNRLHYEKLMKHRKPRREDWRNKPAKRMIREQDSFYIIPSDAQDGDWVFVFRNPPIIVTDEVRTKGVASITMKLDDWVYDPNLFDFNVVEVDDVTSY